MGVWIETRMPRFVVAMKVVTPCMGVWIETTVGWLVISPPFSHTLYGCVDWNCCSNVNCDNGGSHTLYGCVDWNIYGVNHISKQTFWSHPVWVCGLKLSWTCCNTITQRHTLYGCVDWNSFESNHDDLDIKSHPVWVCGLKPFGKGRWWSKGKSHPVWVCGLKREKRSMYRIISVSHPVWVCGLKHKIIDATIQSDSHTLYGCVDWNRFDRIGTQLIACHTLYGCVDWNAWS